jgi:hypothetical protein
MNSKSTESERPLVISDQEYEIESLPLHQKLMISKTMPSKGNSSYDFGSIGQTKSKSMPSYGTFNDDFVYTRKTEGKKSVPGRGRSPVRVYTYQVTGETNLVLVLLFLVDPKFYLT